MNYDSYGEIINGEETYLRIAKDLLEKNYCVIGWTDEGCDHRDILFTWNGILKHYGSLQRGFNNCRLWVSIAGVNSCAFLIEDGNNRDNRKHDSYIKEKLNLCDNSCNDKICELINGVIEKIDYLRQNGGYE